MGNPKYIKAAKRLQSNYLRLYNKIVKGHVMYIRDEKHLKKICNNLSEIKKEAEIFGENFKDIVTNNKNVSYALYEAIFELEDISEKETYKKYWRWLMIPGNLGRAYAGLTGKWDHVKSDFERLIKDLERLS